ncbi:GlmL-related ornithine degradation protein [Treponema primitia]|uniref:GlmL-related ornithine degradation protein n=1 Tax=Treponema primitia TaxID=88058 RepID=UPI0002554DD5|nr:GlmL-related ornithine degradation protein [Treponema primitia]
MHVDVLVAEIGSTTTLVNAFQNIDGQDPVLWGQGQAPTSVLEGDVRVGLRGAIGDLCRKKGVESLEYRDMLATSSAAGGLKMTVHGLVYDMTVRAAREAALGAGAIIHMVSAGKLRRTDLEKIREIQPNLIMLAGGVDHGERDTALDNAEALCSLGLSIPVIYGGNIDNQDEIRLIFRDSTMPLYMVENVYPRIDDLNVEPARRVIQAAFEDHIIQAPGMEHVRDMVGGPIIPTPGAVMECAKLLHGAIGDLMVLDVGGATTDLHSVTAGSEEISRISISPEPFAKRTVEGDLGVYVNMHNLVDLIGQDKLASELGFPPEEAMATYKFIPKTEKELQFVERLTLEAVLQATERHAGHIRYIYGPSGRSTLAEGKDLTQVKYIIGTGGALTRLPHRVEMMEAIAKHNETGLFLFPPETAAILVDNDYIMASLGVLSKQYPDAALKLLQKSLHIFP